VFRTVLLSRHLLLLAWVLPDVKIRVTKSDVKQSEANLQIEFSPKRKTIGFGVEQYC
jgi:hypothetical protein